MGLFAAQSHQRLCRVFSTRMARQMASRPGRFRWRVLPSLTVIADDGAPYAPAHRSHNRNLRYENAAKCPALRHFAVSY